VLDSKRFYQALLSPIDLVALGAFIRQGYSHELSYWLFIDSIRRTIAGRTVKYRNDPRAPCEMVGGERRCFKDVIDNGVASGLTVETLAVSNDGAAGAKSSATVYARMCLDPVLAQRFRSEHPNFRSAFIGQAGQPRCGIWPPEVRAGKRRIAETDALNFDLTDAPYGPVHVEVFPRSTFGVYRFFGRILAAEARRPASRGHQPHRRYPPSCGCGWLRWAMLRVDYLRKQILLGTRKRRGIDQTHFQPTGAIAGTQNTEWRSQRGAGGAGDTITAHTCNF
jgi:hypothetical protein